MAAGNTGIIMRMQSVNTQEKISEMAAECGRAGSLQIESLAYERF